MSEDTRLLVALAVSLALSIGVFWYGYKVRRLKPQRAGQWATALGAMAAFAMILWSYFPWWQLALMVAGASIWGWFAVIGIVRQNEFLQRLIRGKTVTHPARATAGDQDQELGAHASDDAKT